MKSGSCGDEPPQGWAEFYLKSIFNRKSKKSMRKWRVKGVKRIAPEVVGAFIESCLLIAMSGSAFAQTADGNNGITQATSTIAGYFDAGCNLMYAIGAILGLIGAVKVYQKWNHGDHDTSKVAAAWFGSCIFLVIVATVLKAFFGVS
jgi:glycerol uptake facilitator-like aquaporin